METVEDFTGLDSGEETVVRKIYWSVCHSVQFARDYDFVNALQITSKVTIKLMKTYEIHLSFTCWMTAPIGTKP